MGTTKKSEARHRVVGKRTKPAARDEQPKEDAKSSIADLAQPVPSIAMASSLDARLRGQASWLFGIAKDCWFPDALRARASKNIAVAIGREFPELVNSGDVESNADSIRSFWDDLAGPRSVIDESFDGENVEDKEAELTVDVVAFAFRVAGASPRQINLAKRAVLPTTAPLDPERLAAVRKKLRALLAKPRRSEGTQKQDRAAALLAAASQRCESYERAAPEPFFLVTTQSRNGVEELLPPKEVRDGVDELVGVELAHLRERLAEWLDRNPDDTRRREVHRLLSDIMLTEEIFGPESFAKVRWFKAIGRMLPVLREFQPFAEVRHREESHLLSRGGRLERRVAQLQRVVALVGELAGLLDELEPAFDERDLKFIDPRGRGRRPAPRYVTAAQRILEETGFSRHEIVRLFAKDGASEKDLRDAAEALRKRLGKVDE